MSDNPYQAPQSAARVDSGKHFQIAKAQKNVIYVLLAQILFNLIAFPAVLSSPESTAVLTIVRVIGLLLSIASLVVLYQLASKVYNVGLGVLCAILGFLPCIGLVTLLVVNGTATGILKSAGYKVGLMGANLNQFQ